MGLRNTLAGERRARGWSQARVAQLAGITRQSYAAIEAGHSVPSTEVSLRLAAAFGTTVEAIFRLPEAPVERVRVRLAAGDWRRGARLRLGRVGSRLLAYGLGGDRELRVADGWMAGVGAGDPREAAEAWEGRSAEVELLPERGAVAELVVAGCDPAFGLVAETLQRRRGWEVLGWTRSSLGALEALARGEVHVAGVHLRDPAGDGYNRTWVERTVPLPCTRVTFALWEQGLLVARGNPLGIHGLDDLARPEVRFLNRQPGSGSRNLLDERLERAGVEPDRIPGYATIARGHLGLAEAIASGLADAGVGIRAAAGMYGLDFLPLAVERYELVVPDRFLELTTVQALLEALRDRGLRAQIEALGGYDLSGCGEAA